MGLRLAEYRRTRLIAWIPGAFALAVAVSSPVRAEVCSALFEKIEISPELKAYLDDPVAGDRVVKYLGYSADEPFVRFYSDVEAWLRLEKDTGKASAKTATFTMDGGAPLFKGILKRSKYSIETRMVVEKPGEIALRFEIDAARVSAPAAILDLQTMQLALVKRLFDAFGATGAELRQIRIEWKLGRNAPENFGAHLAGDLKFAKTHEITNCSLPKVLLLTLGGSVGGGGVGAAVGTWLNDNEISTVEEAGAQLTRASIGGAAVGGTLSVIVGCRRRSVQGGTWELVFRRIPPKT
jgi:hypothetical protein